MAAAESITTITLERGCFGCAGASLVLQRDGTASLTVTGNARMGTQDQVSRGKLPAVDFAALARLAVAEGFLQLQDVYEDPDLRDGAWSTVTLSGGAGRATNTSIKRVFRREEAGPEALKAVETAIETLKARIRFQPERP